MRTIIIVLFAIFVICPNGNASEEWGKTGHRVVGQIAQKYLTSRAKRQISKLLDGHSLAFVANYGDDIKSDPQYKMFGPWHYVDFPMGTTYENAEKNDKGDLITGINKCLEILNNENSPKDEKVFYLKMLVHFMGDLHQPLHVGLAEDKGGNDFQVRWFNEGSNLHTVWDSSMIDSYQMSYTELAKNADKLSKEEIKDIQKGSLKDWMYDSRSLFENIYDTAEVGQKLGYQYMYDYMDVVRLQLQKAGIRLAEILNRIFS